MKNLTVLTHTISALTALICLFAITACAHMSYQDCRDMNWHVTGLSDASTGVPARNGIDHARVCSKYGISFNHEQYNAGYQAGSEKYCTKENGFEVGKSGTEYLSVCPATNESDFLLGWNAGNALWTAIDRVRSAEKVRLNAVVSLLGPEVRDDRQSREIESARLSEIQRKQVLDGTDGPHFGTGVLPWDYAHTSHVSKIDRLIRECVAVQQRVAALGFGVDDACD